MTILHYLFALAFAWADERISLCAWESAFDARWYMERWLWWGHPLPTMLKRVEWWGLDRYARYVYQGPNRRMNAWERVWTGEAFDCALQTTFWELFPKTYPADDLPF